MGETLFKQAITKYVNKLCAENIEAAHFLSDNLLVLQSGREYPRSYVDVIMQKWERLSLDLYDSYCFAQVHAAIRCGDLGIFQISVGSSPSSDRHEVLNNEKLSSLSHPFSASFNPDHFGADGMVNWDLPINVFVSGQMDEYGKDYTIFAIIPPGNAPLEVGYQNSEKTYYQTLTAFRCANGLARWPYGSDEITILVPAETLIFLDEDGFKELSETVYGSFFTLPNPWKQWNKEHERQRTGVASL